MTSLAWFSPAGCFAFWAWLDAEQPALAPHGTCGTLILFAITLARVDSSHAGRAYDAYGGIYIASSLVFWAPILG